MAAIALPATMSPVSACRAGIRRPPSTGIPDAEMSARAAAMLPTIAEPRPVVAEPPPGRGVPPGAAPVPAVVRGPAEARGPAAARTRLALPVPTMAPAPADGSADTPHGPPLDALGQRTGLGGPAPMTARSRSSSSGALTGPRSALPRTSSSSSSTVDTAASCASARSQTTRHTVKTVRIGSVAVLPAEHAPPGGVSTTRTAPSGRTTTPSMSRAPNSTDPSSTERTRPRSGIVSVTATPEDSDPSRSSASTMGSPVTSDRRTLGRSSSALRTFATATTCGEGAAPRASVHSTKASTSSVRSQRVHGCCPSGSVSMATSVAEPHRASSPTRATCGQRADSGRCGRRENGV
ncbi:hypothetical protein [Curtobacterium sp. Leaf261]|uniref:hypothetical protein n=1 Tax=Curtobacterium sp. Leaf261 TaxID=1736311 RepID=UPI0007002EA0|nr:hypothetical protein [Curtobacterium sp. Leaf261]KQO64957.1 hypothetical protein ASF23_02015 [Curtobacterium sp. Leaf261]